MQGRVWLASHIKLPTELPERSAAYRLILVEFAAFAMLGRAWLAPNQTSYQLPERPGAHRLIVVDLIKVQTGWERSYPTRINADLRSCGYSESSL